MVWKEVAAALGLGQTVYENFQAGKKPVHDKKALKAAGVPPCAATEKKWYNDCVRVGSGELIWAINSAGQSATFTRLKSGVQIPHRPPPPHTHTSFCRTATVLGIVD